MTDKLNFLVKKDLWLATTGEPKFETIGWTTTKPEYYNGHIKKNTALIFSHMVMDKGTKDNLKDALNFVTILTGPIYDTKSRPEFFQKEIESLIKEGVLELIQMNEIIEATVVPGFPELTQGPILIRESQDLVFSKEAILPFYQINVVMGQREQRQSKGKVQIGEKISLRNILDIYSTAVGLNLILK